MPDYIALKTNQNRKGAGYKPALSNIEYYGKGKLRLININCWSNAMDTMAQVYADAT
jgi:hypothetical protein